MMRGITIYLVLACAVPVVAQTNVQGDSRQRLIKLNVAATSAKGDPVTDLSAADVQLREDGKPQAIAFFRFAGRQASTVLHAQGEFVNHPVTAPLVILLDRWNERMTTTAQAWIELGTAVQRLESVQSVYIYVLTSNGDLSAVRPLPVTEADLSATSPLSPVELRAQLDEAVRKIQGFKARDDLRMRVLMTFQALDTLRLQMSSITGRKNLIWITQGIPLVIPPRIDLTPQVRSLSEMAARAQIAIYTVDQSSGSGASLSNEVLALRMFSALTGGRWYPSDNAERSIADARTDARGSYRIAYYSTVAEKDNKEHKIRVDATRKGIHLLTRDQFVSEVAESDADQLEAEFGSGRARLSMPPKSACGRRCLASRQLPRSISKSASIRRI
jgi:VWFA-related protein